jgi:DNA-binding MarR family transcriptional regulator
VTGDQPRDPLTVALFGEIVMIEQLARARLARALPRGMELSHFMTLNHLAGVGAERSPAQLARVFHVSKGAMTNTLQRLDAAGYIHIRPDWDDARRKWVSLSPAGHAARDRAVVAIAPVFDDLVARLGVERLRATLPALRAIRECLDPGATGLENALSRRPRGAMT